MHKENWDDLRFVLAVVEGGTVSAAARALGVNHATVLRRIASFETNHGGDIFLRESHGYKLLPDKVAVIEAAREVKEAVHSVERIMKGVEGQLAGTVRLSSTDTFCQIVLPAFVAGVNAQNSALRVELMCSNDHVDFARLEADIAVRPALKLPETLAGRRVGTLDFAVYAHPDAGEAWLGLSGPLQRSVAARWLSENRPEQSFVAMADSFLVLKEMALMGLGQAILPCILGNATQGLELRSGRLEKVSVPVWVLTHKDLRKTPRLREVEKRLCAFLENEAVLQA